MASRDLTSSVLSEHILSASPHAATYSRATTTAKKRSANRAPPKPPPADPTPKYLNDHNCAATSVALSADRRKTYTHTCNFCGDSTLILATASCEHMRATPAQNGPLSSCNNKNNKSC